MMNENDINYISTLVLDRQQRLIWALHHVQPFTVLLSDCDEVQDELEKANRALRLLKAQKETSHA
jgi:hypothetical protein